MVIEGQARSTGQRLAAMMVVVVALLLTWGLATATAVSVEERLPPAPSAEHAAMGGGQSEAGPQFPLVRAVSLTESATPVPQIEAMLGAVVSTTLSQYVGDLSGEWPVLVADEWHTITSRLTSDTNEQLEKAAEYVYERLAELGLEVEYHRWDTSLAPNVVGELEGALYPEEIVILSAHLDSTTRENPELVAPGADDNASGVAAVLVAAGILSKFSWGRTVRFALWTGEEQGLWGSKAYAQRSSTREEEIVAVVNLDMIGWDGAGGPDMDLHASQEVTGSLELAELFSDVVGLYDLDLVPEVLADGMGRSDHTSFWAFDYAAILAIENYHPLDAKDFNPHYHTDEDRLEHLNLGYFTEFARAAVGAVAHLGCLVEIGPCRWRLYLPLVARLG